LKSHQHNAAKETKCSRLKLFRSISAQLAGRGQGKQLGQLQR